MTIIGSGKAARAAALLAGLALATGLVGAPGAAAQSFEGRVHGDIRDTDGGVMPGVTVTLTDRETGAARTAVSTSVGEFSFDHLRPGTYDLRAELSGFAPFVQEGLIVGISAFVVVEVDLAVGGIEETITVTAETPLVESASASVASAVDREQLEILPSPGRNVFIMSVGTPNVVHTGNPVWVKPSDQTNSSLLSLGGGPLRGNNYTVDGVSVTDLRNRAVIVPSFEAIQEMKVQTNTYDAEMGRTGGGVFNVIHRRGANTWTGSTLFQTRPRKLNTPWRKLAFFQQRELDRGDITEADLIEAPFYLGAGSLGGPIRRDRTFFFLSGEGYYDELFGNTTVTLPSPAQVAGDFSGSGRTIYDPLDRDANGDRRPFPGNVIPADRIDPTGAALANLLTTLGTPGDHSTSGLEPIAAVVLTGNLNHSFADSVQTSGTYMYYKSSDRGFQHYADLLNVDESPVFGPGAVVLERVVHAGALNTTFLPSETSVLTLRYGQTYFYDSYVSTPYGADGFRSELGMTGDFVDKLYADENHPGQFPLIFVDNYGDGGRTHSGWSNSDVDWTSREVSGAYSTYRGHHTLKIGGQWRRMGLNATEYRNGLILRFRQNFTQGPNPLAPAEGSGDALADLLLGIPSGGQFTLARPTEVFIDYFGGFVQDDWHPTHDLVLNLGLRVERETGLRENDDEFAVGWDRENPFPVQVAPPAGLDAGALSGFPLRGGLLYAGVEGNPTHQWDPPAVKFGPRVGFAWSVNHETVLRGGYAVFWAPYAIPLNTDASSLGAYGYSEVTNVPTSFDGVTPPQATASNPFPDGVGDPVGNRRGRFQNIGANVFFNEQFRASPYIQKWSLDLQREFGQVLVAKVGYVGSRGSNLGIGGTEDAVVNINQLPNSALALGGEALNAPVANPFHGDERFGAFSQQETLPYGQLLRPYPHFRDVLARHVSAGKSLYHSLRLEFEKRFEGNWGARVNYTFTRHQDNIYEGNTLLESETTTVYDTPDECAFSKCPVIEADYGPSRIHVPHVLNINGSYTVPWDHPIYGGWSLSVAALLRSGFPLVVTQTSNPLAAYGFDHQRPANVGIAAGGRASENPDTYVTPGSTTLSEGLTISGAPHTTDLVRTPPLFNWDVSLEKTTRISDLDLMLRFEFINLLNQVNWRGPRTVLGADNFGSIPGTRGFPRTLQLMAKITF